MNKYPSRYSPGKFVTPAQYITEFICEKKARLDNKDLPTRFWEIKTWQTFFRQQVVAANELLKEFSVEAILASLKHPKAFRVFSLRAPFLRSIIQAEHERLSKLPKPSNSTVVNTVDPTSQPRSGFNQSDRLRNL